MADVIVHDEDEDEGLEDVAVQAAAVQQGVATVRAEQATEAASRATTAAESAVMAVGGIDAVAEEAQEAAQVAVGAANVSVEAVSALTSAIERQNELLASWYENMSQAQVSQAPVPTKPTRKKADTAPESAKKKRTFADRYYGR